MLHLHCPVYLSSGSGNTKRLCPGARAHYEPGSLSHNGDTMQKQEKRIVNRDILLCIRKKRLERRCREIIRDKGERYWSEKEASGTGNNQFIAGGPQPSIYEAGDAIKKIC